MSAAYFEDHPTDPNKVILRKRSCPFCQDKQRTWQGLTDEEIDELWDETVKYAPSEVRIRDFARAIEAKLKEKK